MQVINKGNSVRIILADGAGGGAKPFLILQLVIFGSFILGVLAVIGISVVNERYGIAAFLTVTASLFLTLAYRLLVSINRSESVELTIDALILGKSKLGRTVTNTYYYQGIANLCYVGQNRHMRADTMNTWGAMQYVNSIVHEGDIVFYYEGALIRFGARAAIWDIEALSAMIEEHSSGTLSIAGLPEEITEDEWSTES